MRPGTVIHDPSFEFHDSSEPGNKILIVLNDAPTLNNVYLIAKTTSNPAYKQEINGCNLNDKYPNFFIPQGKCLLNENTWVLLNEFYEFTYNDWLGKFFKERDVRELGCLPIDIFKELIECSIRSEDISFIQEESLKETLKTLS